MNKIITLFSLLFVFASTCFSQDTTSADVPLTILEKAATKSGSIIKKEYQKIDDVRGLEIQVLTITTARDDSRKGIVLTGNATSSFSTRSQFYTTYLDPEELEDFIKFLDLIKEVLQTKEPSNYTEYNFNTTDNFQAFIYNAIGPYGNNWHYGFDLDRRFTGGRFDFKEKDIDKILIAFKLGRNKLMEASNQN